MIEEFMLAANISVAEKILKHFPLCSLLRCTFFQFFYLVTPDEVKIMHIQRYMQLVGKALGNIHQFWSNKFTTFTS